MRVPITPPSFFGEMVLIKEWDKFGRLISPISFEEKCKLWNACIKNAKRSDGFVDRVVFEHGYLWPLSVRRTFE